GGSSWTGKPIGSSEMRWTSCAYAIGRRLQRIGRQSLKWRSSLSEQQFILHRRDSSSCTMRRNSRTSGSDCAVRYWTIWRARQQTSDNGGFSRALPALRSALAFAADELFDAAIGFVVGHLHRWML